MKLYRFCILGSEFRREVLEVEEKPKTYTVVGCYFRQRIAKEDIGTVDCHGFVHLLEDNEIRAIRILKQDIKNMVDRENERHKKIIKAYSSSLKILHDAEDTVHE